jgi:hypothetical protein
MLACFLGYTERFSSLFEVGFVFLSSQLSWLLGTGFRCSVAACLAPCNTSVLFCAAGSAGDASWLPAGAGAAACCGRWEGGSTLVSLGYVTSKAPVTSASSLAVECGPAVARRHDTAARVCTCRWLVRAEAAICCCCGNEAVPVLNRCCMPGTTHGL